MPKGQVIYSPRIMASGKTKRAIIRRHAQTLFIECVRYLPALTGKPLKALKRFMTLYQENPYYWLSRGNSAVAEEELDELIKLTKICQSLEQKDYQVDKEPLEQALKNLEYDSIIPSKTDGQNWVILKVDLRTVEEELKGLRAAGVNISGSAWGPHISIVRGEEVPPMAWDLKPLANSIIEFELGKFRHNKQSYYWYDIECPGLEEVRTSLFLSPRPTPGFHLTLGKIQ